ncbi:MAG: right-handed parallel beta-helix repeat-containing protein [Phycisphaerales bacterium]
MPSRTMWNTLVLLTAISIATIGLIAGPLDPPAGAVSSTYKTLAEVEPRCIIASTPTIISTPGSYYLGGDIMHTGPSPAITIAADGVTLDLRGFALRGTPGTTDGVLITGTHATVVNGAIEGFGGSGLSAIGSTGLRARGLHLTMNSGYGIRAEDSTIVEDVQALSNGTPASPTAGISVHNDFVIRGCIADRNAGCGIAAAQAGIIEGCTANSNSAQGIVAYTSARIMNCSVFRNGSHGIAVNGSCSIENNVAHENAWQPFVPGAAGIFVADQSTRIDSNHVVASPIGIRADGVRSVVVRNTVTYCPTPISAVAPNTLGEIISNPGASILTLDAQNSSPWANFTGE